MNEFDDILKDVQTRSAPKESVPPPVESAPSNNFSDITDALPTPEATKKRNRFIQDKNLKKVALGEAGGLGFAAFNIAAEVFNVFDSLRSIGFHNAVNADGIVEDIAPAAPIENKLDVASIASAILNNRDPMKAALQFVGEENPELTQAFQDAGDAIFKGKDFTFADVLEKEGVPVELAEPIGTGLTFVTDPLLMSGVGELARGIKQIPNMLKIMLRKKETIAQEIFESVGTSTLKELGVETAEDLLHLVEKGTFKKPSLKVKKAMLALKKEFLTAKSGTLTKEVIDALAGKGALSGLPLSIQHKVRQAVLGTPALASVDAGVLANHLSRLGGNSAAKFELYHKVLSGVASIDDLAKLTAVEQSYLKQARTLLDEHSALLGQELESLLKSDPQLFANLQAKFGFKGGKPIPLPTLVETMKKNIGSYIKREYLLYRPNVKYVPTAEIRKAAVEGLLRQKAVKTEEKANEILNRILNKESVTLNFKQQKSLNRLKIDQGGFIARQNIPKYLREFMGEIKDPMYNITHTAGYLAEQRGHLQMFREMKEAGLFGEKSATKTVQIKSGNPIAWGAIEGQYTTPEVASALEHIAAQSEVSVDGVASTMRFMKLVKTILNPKTHAHNFLGNIWFSILSGNSIVNPANATHYRRMVKMWRTAVDVGKGKIPASHALFQEWRELAANGVIGTELPSAEKLVYLERLMKDPYALQNVGKIKKAADKAVKVAAEFYGFEDQLFKGATYLKYRNNGMSIPSAVHEMYKWYPNYAEAARIAVTARNTTVGLMFANPFTTFRLEAHRIMLNAFKDSARTRMLMGLNLTSRGAWNTGVMMASGLGMAEVMEAFQVRPELATNTVLNPLSSEGNFDLNLKYVDPFNTEGLYAPLQWLSGASGIQLHDYLADFTTFSPEFGYSNLVVSAFEPLATGKGKFGEQLSALERGSEGIKAVAGSSFSIDIPKFLEAEEDAERSRRSLRFFGVDVEKRQRNFEKSDIRERFEKKIEKKEDTASLEQAVTFLGFNAARLKSNAVKNVTKKKKEKLERRIAPKSIGDSLKNALEGLF